MKKAFALVLALVLALGVFAACGETKPVETTKAPETTTAPADTTAPAETTEPAATEYTFPAGAELNIWSGHDINDLPLDKFVEEATGLSITWTPMGGNLEAYRAALTQKVTPDLFYLWGYEPAHELGRYGALVNLWEYRDIMPNLFKHFDAEGEKIKQQYMTSEDELYCAPIWLNCELERYGWMYREDIFAKHNLTEPTTWDEFLNVCKVLKEAYPESYPFTMRNMNGAMFCFTELAQQFGVKYSATTPVLDEATGTYYNTWTTDEARYMVKLFRELIELGYMDVATLAYSTAEWMASMSSGKSFITYEKSWQLRNIEQAGKEINEEFSLQWWNNLPYVESDLPYQCRTYDNYNYGWYVSARCADVELALRYLDWMYSEEGSLILSWGVEGESYGVDENGNKYFLEGYDATYQARYQETGYIDPLASMAPYPGKTTEMFLDTMKEAKEGNFWADPALVFTTEEQATLATYQTDWQNAKDQYWQKFLLGDLDIDDDATWNQFKTDIAAYGEADILAAYNAAYARLQEG